MSDKTLTPITHNETATIALKFINQHFNNPDKERPRASIPANPHRDDDLRLMQYIREQKAAPPPDTSLLRAYAECEEAYIKTASVDAAIPLWSRHGYTGEREWEPVRAWLDDLRRRALAGETK